MSILVDNLVRVYGAQGCASYRRVGNLKYIAKPVDLMSFYNVIRRVKDAWRVLVGKSQAYHYYEDEHEV